MRYILFGVVLAASAALGSPDLKASFQVRLIGSGPLVDTISIRSVLKNNGSSVATSPIYPLGFGTLSVGIGALRVGLHSIVTLQPGDSAVFFDSSIAPQMAFSVWTWCDPLHVFDDAGGTIDNVQAFSYNFHPQVTMVHDTTRITLRDTLRIHDTTAVHDTVRACTTPARPAAKTSTRSRVYSLDGAFIREDVSP